MDSTNLRAPLYLAVCWFAVLAAPGGRAAAAGTTALEAQPWTAVPSPIDRSRVHYDDSEAGVIWARGATYKATFSSDGTDYIPFLGEAAPQSYPVRFRVESAISGGEALDLAREVAPLRDGDTVSYERGALVEIYDLAPESIEQKFLFASLPSTGDLSLRIAFESELSARVAGESLELENGWGSVRYGRALALDARGKTQLAPTILHDGAIEIRVPAAFLATARFPLTIDPIISTFSVAATAADERSPDAAYAFVSNRYMVAYEQRFSATDRDIYVLLFDPTGAPVLGAYLEQTTAYWANPKVASHRTADQFLVVAEVGLPTSGARTIRGRTAAASNLAMSALFTISGAETGDKLNPDVGGEQNLSTVTATYYCVVWERALSATNHDIHARLVTSSATVFGAGTILLDNGVSTLDTEPAISESNGRGSATTREWNVVWQRLISPGDHDIRAAQIHWSGGITTAPFTPIPDPLYDDIHPDVSSPLDEVGGGGAPLPRNYLIVGERHTATAHIVMSMYMRAAQLIDQKNLIALQGFDTAALRSYPSIDSDGKCFAVAYAEQVQPSTTNYDMFITTFAPIEGTTDFDDALYLSEPKLALATSSSREDHADVVGTYSGGGGGWRFLTVWDDDAGGVGLGNVEGSLYDCGQYTAFCRAASEEVIDCPCGNPAFGPGKRGCNNSGATGGAVLAASGAASIAADTMVMTASDELPTALSIFNQGTALIPTGVVFGQGVRCVGGSLKRLYTKPASGGVATAPVGADPSVSARSAALGDPLSAGTTRYYYTYYRDPVVLGGCPSTSTFNVTQALRAIWSP